MKEHRYSIRMTWTGNDGEGTQTYRGYRRDHTILAEGRPPVLGSSDPAFRGDPTRYSPEDLLVASLSSCHMLWYLHLCATRGVIVTSYQDGAMGYMNEDDTGAGRFVRVVLRPDIVIGANSDAAVARELHEPAHAACFIANSVNFPVVVEPTIHVGPHSSTAAADTAS